MILQALPTRLTWSTQRRALCSESCPGLPTAHCCSWQPDHACALYSKHCQQGLLGVHKGEPSVDKVAQVCQQLIVALGSQIMRVHYIPSTVNKAYLVYTKESPLLIKLPRFANSSLLFLAARSLHLKSVSDCSGLFASR